MIDAYLAMLAVDLAVVVLVIEALVLLLLWKMRRRGLPPATTLLIAGAGLGLLLAIRAAITGASPLFVLAGLALGGLAHAVDLFRRLKGR